MEKPDTLDDLIVSEQRYRDILYNMDDGYYEVDLAGNFTFFNKAMTRIAGYSEHEMLGMNNRDYTSPETAKRMFHIYNMIFKTGKPSRVFDYEIIRKDKTIRVLEVSASLIQNAQGIPTGFRGIARDRTDINNAELDKRKLEKQLNQVLRMEAIGTLAGGIAHDFNNILTGINGYISILKLKLEKESPLYSKLLRIDELVQSGADLTRQLLGFAMGGKYEVKPININDIIGKNLDMVNRANKHVRIIKHLQKDLWPVEADANQIEQVMLNLYLNAVHAMPKGGDLSIETENAFIDKHSAIYLDLTSGKYVKIRVSDTGIGMDKQTIEKIFEPFFTTKEMGRGTGLGLASAYGIIKNHKGKISVESSEAEGSVFTIYLPSTNKRAPAISRDSDEVKVASGSETILLVDDENSVRQVGEEIIRGIGYQVITASSGEDAVDIYKANQNVIDIVVLDIVMPKMGGKKTFEALKRINPDIKVLFASGYSPEGQAAGMLTQGNTGYIQKPFGMRSLSCKLREILDRTAT